MVLVVVMYPVYESTLPFALKLTLEFVLVSLAIAMLWLRDRDASG